MSIISAVKEMIARLVSKCIDVAIAPCPTTREKREHEQLFILLHFQIAGY